MGIEVGGILGLLILIADIWASVNIAQSGASTGTKILWIALVVVLPVAGKAPMRCAAVLLALLTVAACSERPNTLQPAEAIARVMDENHKASEALVQAARDAASTAGDQAHDAATARQSMRSWGPATRRASKRGREPAFL